MRELTDLFRERFLMIAREVIPDDSEWELYRYQIVPVMMVAPGAAQEAIQAGRAPEPIVSISYFLMRPSRDPGDWLAQHDMILDPFCDDDTIRRSFGAVRDKLRNEFWNTFPPELKEGDGAVPIASARTDKR